MAEPKFTVQIGDAVQMSLFNDGAAFSLDVRVRGTDDIARLLFVASDNGVFMQRFLQAAALAHQAQMALPESERAATNPPVLPLKGVHIAPSPDLAGVAMNLEVGPGAAIPLHLTIEQSRAMAESLLRHAQTVERGLH